MGPSQLVAAMTGDDPQLFVEDGARRGLIVADNYKLGGQLEFALHGRADVYVMDHKKNRQHGRAPQLDVWDIGETALPAQHGRDALVIVDLTETSEKRIDAWVAHIATFFEGLEPVGEIRFEKPTRIGKPPKRFRYDLYRGVVKTSPAQTQADSPGG
jgi:hypothetical protein